MFILTSWFILSILAGLASNTFNFISRFLLKDSEDETAYAWFFEFIRFIFFIILALFDWHMVIAPQSILLFFLLGLTEWISVYWYMKMHKHSHLSVSAILSRTRLIWVPVFALFLIHEDLKMTEYIGIAVLFIGLSIVISPKNLMVDKGAMYANLSSFVIALNVVLTKIALSFGSNSVINSSIAFIPSILFPFTMKNPVSRLKSVFKKNLSLKLIAVSVNIISAYLFTEALRFGEAGKITAVYQGTLIIAVLAGIIFLKERKNIAQKLIGSALTIIGVFLLS